MVPFHNRIIGNFMVYQSWLETKSLQIFAHPENSEMFSIICYNICYYFWEHDRCCTEAGIIDSDIFVFTSFHCLQLFYSPLHYRCSGVPESYANVLDLMGNACSVQALKIKTALLHQARWLWTQFIIAANANESKLSGGKFEATANYVWETFIFSKNTIKAALFFGYF